MATGPALASVHDGSACSQGSPAGSGVPYQSDCTASGFTRTSDSHLRLTGLGPTVYSYDNDDLLSQAGELVSERLDADSAKRSDGARPLSPWNLGQANVGRIRVGSFFSDAQGS